MSHYNFWKSCYQLPAYSEKTDKTNHVFEKYGVFTIKICDNAYNFNFQYLNNIFVNYKNFAMWSAELCSFIMLKTAL